VVVVLLLHAHFLLLSRFFAGAAITAAAAATDFSRCLGLVSSYQPNLGAACLSVPNGIGCVVDAPERSIDGDFPLATPTHSIVDAKHQILTVTVH
jgi:hypothetical protein